MTEPHIYAVSLTEGEIRALISCLDDLSDYYGDLEDHEQAILNKLLALIQDAPR